ncbi:MAG: nucleotidyltransferase domain-containing protein [Thaumarchaeota archaeon]|jgi:predicted nucleotidyltransferase|nr:nucleotidyltransferase domain-containing protein [Candidatus Geocrenenecus arthurdayi]
MSVVRDHDFLEDSDGWMFCVVGDVHPPEGFFAYPKYTPGPGPWRRGVQSFRRTIEKYSMSELKKLLGYLKTSRPEYIRHDGVLDAEMFFLPSMKVLKHYSCVEGLKNIIGKDARDVLEQFLVDFIYEISDSSGVSLEYLGVTGSILLGIHHEKSDIDLVVYGRENYWKIIDILEEKTSPRYHHSLRRFSTVYPISWSDAEKLARRVKHKRTYHGVDFSLYGVRKIDEINEVYGDYIYRKVGIAKAELEVVDSSNSCFTPSIYLVEGYAEISGNRYPVEKLTCYDLTYTALFHEGDRLQVYGKLEEVIDRRNSNKFYSILFGSFEAAGIEYIRLLT